jgi:hypothetical protein
MTPRPILKSAHRISLENLNSAVPSIPPAPFPFSSCSSLSPHVHFPPTPTLTSTFAVDHYDRAPISISPNICSLPNRGERVYQATSPPCYNNRNRRSNVGSYFHPRAFEACTIEHATPVSSPLFSPSTTPELSISPDDSETDDGSPQSPLSPELGPDIPYYDAKLRLVLPEASTLPPDAGRLSSFMNRGHTPNHGQPEPHRQLRRLRPKRPNTLTSSNVRAPVSDAIVAQRKTPLRSEYKAFSNADSCCLDGF